MVPSDAIMAPGIEIPSADENNTAAAEEEEAEENPVEDEPQSSPVDEEENEEDESAPIEEEEEEDKEPRNYDDLDLNYSKNAFASSYSSGNGPLNAIDGDSNGQHPDGSCFQSEDENQPFWTGNLKQAYFISTVSVYGREDCCDEELENYIIYIGNDEDFTKNQ